MTGLHFKEWKVSQNMRLLVEAIKSPMQLNIEGSFYVGEYGIGFGANICNIIGIDVSSAWRTDHSDKDLEVRKEKACLRSHSKLVPGCGCQRPPH